MNETSINVLKQYGAGEKTIQKIKDANINTLQDVLKFNSKELAVKLKIGQGVAAKIIEVSNEYLLQKQVFTVRNIANVTVETCYGIRIAVRCIITHDDILYAERKDNTAGDYEYCRLHPNSNYSLRPFEKVTDQFYEHNLHLSDGENTGKWLQILNRYIYEIGDKMFSRNTAMDYRFKQRDTDYKVEIDYYNEKRIGLNNELRSYLL